MKGLVQDKGSRSVGWWKDRIESLEDDFVQYLLQSCAFTRGKQPVEWDNSMSEIECKLMDDILELKDWLNEMLEEGKKEQETHEQRR
jgi:hypothetical protein